MTKQIVCAVFDSAVQAYGRPLFLRAKGEAVRAFMDEVARKAEGNQLNLHPEDYELRMLGIWDDENGQFTNDEVSVLMRGKDVVQS